MIPWAQAGEALAEQAVLAGNDEADSDHCDPEPPGEGPASYRGDQGVQDVLGDLDDPAVAHLASCPGALDDRASASASPSRGWASCRAAGWGWRAPGCQAFLSLMPVLIL